MAALRRIAGKGSIIISTATSYSLLISCRGIATKLFVGGLSYYTTDKGLTEAFSQYGQVVEATVVSDRISDKSKGFGFVTFASEDEAHTALTEMNRKILNGRAIYVDYAKPRTSFKNEMPVARGPPEPSENIESSNADLC